MILYCSKVNQLEKKNDILKQELSDKDLELDKLQEQLKESKACEAKDDAVKYYKDQIQVAEKDRDEKVA